MWGSFVCLCLCALLVVLAISVNWCAFKVSDGGVCSYCVVCTAASWSLELVRIGPSQVHMAGHTCDCHNVPACLHVRIGHTQVRNLQPCLKLARDLIVPDHLPQYVAEWKQVRVHTVDL